MCPCAITFPFLFPIPLEYASEIKVVNYFFDEERPPFLIADAG